MARLNIELNDISHKFKPLLWSGKNAIFERDKTAHVLAEYISTEHHEHPKATQLIIAHSHGGNIALRALQHLQKLDASKLDRADRASPFVVTLAAPFIEIHKADLGRRPTRVRLALVLAISLFVLAFNLFVVLPLIDDNVPPNWRSLFLESGILFRTIVYAPLAISFVVYQGKRNDY